MVVPAPAHVEWGRGEPAHHPNPPNQRLHLGAVRHITNSSPLRNHQPLRVGLLRGGVDELPGGEPDQELRRVGLLYSDWRGAVLPDGRLPNIHFRNMFEALTYHVRARAAGPAESFCETAG